VIVENKAGGGGVIGATETVRAAPDGYTWAWPRCPPRRPTRPSTPRSRTTRSTDFTPIINIAATPNVIAVHPSFPAKDYKGFVGR
jgi:tripartite-type tricarboxylate transporter receptor subunit TctC